MTIPRRRRCVICGKLTEKWQRVNSSAWHCYDGCKSTTGIDYRAAPIAGITMVEEKDMTQKQLNKIIEELENEAAKYGTASMNDRAVGKRYNAMKLTWLSCGLNEAVKIIERMRGRK